MLLTYTNEQARDVAAKSAGFVSAPDVHRPRRWRAANDDAHDDDAPEEASFMRWIPLAVPLLASILCFEAYLIGWFVLALPFAHA